MKHVRKVIEIDEALCNGCGECVPACHEGAIQIVDGKAKLVAETYCDGLGDCLGECPTGALKIVEREADDFDETAVAQHIERLHAAQPPPVPSACPGAALRSLGSAPPGAASPATDSAPTPSALSHWPVQIRLVPPTAPFLEGADLLVAADCVPVACPDFHQDFLRGKVVLLGCPKFDDVALYEQRFEDIFRANEVNSVTVVVMQVPCCQGLPILVEKAMARAGRRVPIEIVVVGLEGNVLDRRKNAV